MEMRDVEEFYNYGISMVAGIVIVLILTYFKNDIFLWFYEDAIIQVIQEQVKNEYLK